MNDIKSDVKRTDGVAVKPLAVTVRELRDDVTSFLRTRYQMLATEMNEKLTAIKVALPSIAIAAVFGLVGFLALTAALVYIIAFAIGIGWSLLVVGLVYCFIAGGAGWTALGELSKGMAPKRTLEVLKQDQVWLQEEARSA
jgi:uncharacterized membrane protein YqjE